jgi:mannosyltransferase OCH1-like enzyme
MVRIFPRRITQIWIQGYEKIEKDIFRQNIHNWQILNQKWEYKLLDDTSLQDTCLRYSQECLEVYNSLEVVSKSDLGRIVDLYLNGGVYVDMDMYALRSLDSSKELNELIEKYENGIASNILGLSSNKASYIESYITVQSDMVLGNVITITNALNPLIKEYLDTMISNFKSTSKNYPRVIYINKTSGPMVFNRFMNNNLINNNKHNITYKIFDYNVFEPCDILGRCDITDNTLSIHKFEASWIGEKSKTCLKFIYQYKSCIYILIVLLMLYIICMIYRKIY